MNKNFKTILKYLLELLIVSFGVFLGSYVGEWREQKVLDKKVDQSLELMVEELKENKNSLERTVEYHKKLRVEIDSIGKQLTKEEKDQRISSTSIFSLQDMPSWKGIQLPALESVAYESAKINGTLGEMSFKKIRYFSIIQDKIRIQVDYGDRLVDQLLSIDSETKVSDCIRTIKLLTYEYANLEGELIKSLDKGIGQLENKKKTKTNSD
ncbi:MAG: hypothetical protein MRZ79_26160 [Bacteroidia bacterium]|nr:hypothetical protein [Bacteroidia bacterium]